MIEARIPSVFFRKNRLQESERGLRRGFADLPEDCNAGSQENILRTVIPGGWSAVVVSYLYFVCDHGRSMVIFILNRM